MFLFIVHVVKREVHNLNSAEPFAVAVAWVLCYDEEVYLKPLCALLVLIHISLPIVFI